MPARAAGLTLDAVRELLPCLHSEQRFQPCDKTRRILGEELASLDARLTQLEQSRKLLAGLLADIPDADIG